MLNSLRAIGYSFEAALADIVDNSVASGASRVDIQFRAVPAPWISFADDGCGMTEDTLIEAMRHGGFGPDRVRGPSDLGRFGLGLKTASLSQCRRLTVVSRTSEGFCGARWDLDEIERSGGWALDVLSPQEAAELAQAAALSGIATGTVVVWEDFDRAVAGEASVATALGELLDVGREHLALVFHRFIGAEDPHERLVLTVNNLAIAALDPFLSHDRSTQRLPPEILEVEGVDVVFRPFILPHASRLTAGELALAGGEEGLRRNQGFYVYRNRRLITSGTWFRLVRQEEMTKLARVQVDIPNTLDHLWALDVKKSAAHPPEAIRAGLRRVVERIADTSRHVYRFRGRRVAGGEVVHAWDRMTARGGVTYVVNRGHPLVAALRTDLEPNGRRRLEQLLRTLEIALPTDSLYADLASERRVQVPSDAHDTEDFLRNLADQMIATAGGDGDARRAVIEALPMIEPFALNPGQTARIAESLRHG